MLEFIAFDKPRISVNIIELVYFVSLSVGTFVVRMRNVHILYSIIMVVWYSMVRFVGT